MSQIIKRFIGDNQVGAAKIQLENNQALTALDSLSAEVDLLKLNASDALEFLILPQYSGSSLATQGYVGTQLGNYIPSTEKGANDGVAELDSNGKVPVAQLPNSVMEYQGTFDPTGPTPNLANGSGNAGDVYIVSVAGSHDFGAGAISFGIGDWVIYNGTIWQKASNSISANGIDGSLIRLANNQYLRARNQAGTADVNILRINTDNYLEIREKLLIDEQFSGVLNIKGFNQSGNTDDINILSGDSSAGNSGNVTLQTGSALSGTAGSISLSPGTNGVDFGNVSILGKNVYLNGQSNGGILYAQNYASVNITSPLGASLLFNSGMNVGDSGSGRPTTVYAKNMDVNDAAPYLYMEETTNNAYVQMYAATPFIDGGNISSTAWFEGSGNTSLVSYTGSIDIYTRGLVGASGSVYVGSGNAGANNSGDLVLRTGTSSATRGKIKLVNGSEGTIGHVWTQNAVDGSGGWAALPAGGATTTLNNLTNTIAIPDSVHLLPANAGAVNLGSATKAFGSMYAQDWHVRNGGIDVANAINNLSMPSGGTATFGIRVNGFDNLFGLITASVTHASFGSGPIRIETGYNGGAGATGSLALRTGNSTSGVSGDISLTVGTGATQGSFKFLKSGVASVVGQVWTASAVDGTGYWANLPASGANTALSNLVTTSINQDLLPDSDGVRSLGSLTLRWANLYADTANFSNASYITFQNAADTGAINVLGVDVSDNTLIDAENILYLTANNSYMGFYASTGDFQFDPGLTSPRLKLHSATTPANFIGIQGPANVPASFTLTLPAADGTSNQALITDGAGNLGWMSIPAAGADTALSNLASTAVNVDIIPANNNSIHLGSQSLMWANVYANTLADSGGFAALSIVNRTLNNTGGTPILDWSSLNISSSVDIVPSAANTYDLGDATAYWQDVYAGGFRAVNSGGFDVRLQLSNSAAASYTLTLPVDDGAANEVLQTDGAGVLSWVALPASATWSRQNFTLSAGDITNGYVNLSNTPIVESLIVVVAGLVSRYNVDYTISGTQLNFSTHTPALIAGDVLEVQYQY